MKYSKRISLARTAFNMAAHRQLKADGLNEGAKSDKLRRESMQLFALAEGFLPASLRVVCERYTSKAFKK